MHTHKHSYTNPYSYLQLILALDYCHRRGVANRDIKLENCLLQNEDGLPHPLLKICDFGYSKADFRSAAKSQVSMDEQMRGIWLGGLRV
jgi:serine/threonine protein kinase